MPAILIQDCRRLLFDMVICVLNDCREWVNSNNERGGKMNENDKPMTEEEVMFQMMMESKSQEEEEAEYWDNMEAMGY